MLTFDVVDASRSFCAAAIYLALASIDSIMNVALGGVRSKDPIHGGEGLRNCGAVGCHRVTQSGDPSPDLRIPDPIVGSGRLCSLSTQRARACMTGQEPLGVRGRHLDIILD